MNIKDFIYETRDDCNADREKLVTLLSNIYERHEDEMFTRFYVMPEPWYKTVQIVITEPRRFKFMKKTVYRYIVDIIFHKSYGDWDSYEANVKLISPTYKEVATMIDKLIPATLRIEERLMNAEKTQSKWSVREKYHKQD